MCVVCGSKTHWADICPRKNEQGSANFVEGKDSDDNDMMMMMVVLRK